MSNFKERFDALSDRDKTRFVREMTRLLRELETDEKMTRLLRELEADETREESE